MRAFICSSFDWLLVLPTTVTVCETLRELRVVIVSSRAELIPETLVEGGRQYKPVLQVTTALGFNWPMDL